MMRTKPIEAGARDPLGLRNLPLLEPDADGWPAIRDALAREQSGRTRRWQAAAGLATAAAVLLAVALLWQQQTPGPAEALTTESATVLAEDAGQEATAPDTNIAGLIAMSQTLEQQLRGLRDGASAMPAESTLYVAELEDLVAQVDNELSQHPDSVNLWGQRVNLMLDLAFLYQQHWEREYGRMASL